MRRLPLPGFWYGEACYRPDGSHGYWASPFHVEPGGRIVPDPVVQTELRRFTTDPLLFTRGHPTGVFAGQSAIGLTGNKEYHESDGVGRVVGDGYGENTILYLRDGTRIQGKPEYGADGLRYQADDGSIVTSDRSRVSPDGLLADYTELHGIRIGSDQIAGLGAVIEIVATGARHILEPGDCRNIRFTFYPPNQLAVYVVKLLEQQAVAFWLTTDGIATLPLYPAPPPTIGPKGPSRPADGHPYGMAPFIHCDPALAGRGGPGQQENVQVDLPGGLTLYGKFGQAGSYEMYGVDANWMTSLEDASGPSESQAWTDPRWFPMDMAVGEAHAFVTGPHFAIYKNRHTCQELRRVAFNRKMWLHQLWDQFDCGPDLGIRPVAMRVYDPSAGFLGKDRIIEVRYEGWHVGWFRWEAHRSDRVYPRGYHGGAEFTAASLVQRVDFYRIGGGHVQPVLTGCVPAVVPHLPPLEPIPKPTPFPPAKPVGGSMRVYFDRAVVQGGLVQKDIGCSPRPVAGKSGDEAFPVYTDRDSDQAWEEAELTPHDGGQFDALFVAANRQLSIDQFGNLQSRAAGAIGPDELFYATRQPDGSNLLYRFEHGALVPCVLTIEEKQS